jgi:pimeloyl-ACP methyl ester carboxylesterase
MTQRPTTTDVTTVTVPGATLYVEVRGSGPVLLCITGGPTDAGMFTDLARRLADRYTPELLPDAARWRAKFADRLHAALQKEAVQ